MFHYRLGFEPFPFLFLPLALRLVLLWFDAVALLHLAQTERIGHEGFVCRLFLLLDSEQRVFADLCSNVPDIVGILNGNEVLVSSTRL